jgi:hypothetical protein
VLSIPKLLFTRDGRRYLYEVRHVYSDLFAATDLH